MKKLLIILIVTAVSLGASAQHGYSRHRAYSRPSIVISTAPVYPYYGYSEPFYSPFHRYGYSSRETRVDRKIADIRRDYKDRIWSARHDKNLRKAERKATIHRLKHERDEAINDAKRNYHRSR